MGEFRLKIVTPQESRETIVCDSVRLCISDDENGKGGGSYGIRPGHAKALFSLEKGEILAFRKGKCVLRGVGGQGFATVDRGQVTAVVEGFAETKTGTERESKHDA